jgi:hypothetical protein
VAQVVEHLPCKNKTLNLKPGTNQKKCFEKKKKRKNLYLCHCETEAQIAKENV